MEKELKSLYHGTDSTFEKFTQDELGKTSKSNPAQMGTWFTDDKEYASGHGKNIIEADVKLSKPKIYSRQEWDSISKKIDFSDLRKQLESLGHDGIMVEGEMTTLGKHKVYNPSIVSVFDTNKIAIKNILNDISGKAIGKTLLKGLGIAAIPALGLISDIATNPVEANVGADMGMTEDEKAYERQKMVLKASPGKKNDILKQALYRGLQGE